MPTRRSAHRQMQIRPRSARRRPKNRTRPFLLFLLVAIVLVMILLYVPPLFYVILILAVLLLLFGFLFWRFWPRERLAQSRRQTMEAASFSAVDSLPRIEPYSLEYLLSLSPEQFEQFTGVVLEVALQHTNIRHMGKSGDEGADLLTDDEHGLPAVVQCKKWAPPGKIGSDVLQKLVGAIIHYGARSGWLVATTTLTGSARKYLAAHYGRIRLLVGPDLVEICQRHAEELDRVWQPYLRDRER